MLEDCSNGGGWWRQQRMFKKLKFKRLKKLLENEDACPTCDIPSLIGACTNCFGFAVTCDIPGIFTAAATIMSCLTGITAYCIYTVNICTGLWGAVADCVDMIGFAFGK
jgi:hypothetical protein